MKKEMMLFSLTVIIVVIADALKEKIGNEIINVFCIPLGATLVVYAGAVMIQGHRGRVFTTYIMTYIIGTLLLIIGLAMSDMRNANEDKVIFDAIFPVLGIMIGAFHLSKIDDNSR